MSKYLNFMDSETGGLNPKTADILTLYMAMVDENMNVVDELNLKLKPDDRLPVVEEGAMRVNKIDLKAHLADPTTVNYSEAKKLVVAFMKKYHRKYGRYNNIRPAGQNVGFDINYIQEYILPKDEWDALFHYAVIDTKAIVDFLKDATWFPPDIGNLESVVSFLQLPARDAHNAKEDTLMCLDVYKKLLDIMKAKKENGSTQDLITLLEAE